MKAFKFLKMEKGVNWRAQRTRGTFETDEKTLENTRLRIGDGLLFSSIPQSRQTFCSINFTSIKGFEYNSVSVIIWNATVNLNTTSFYFC